MKRKPLGLSKEERIVSQRLVGQLFAGDGSHSVAAFPVRAVYRPVDDGGREDVAGDDDGQTAPAVQVLFSVPKRRLKHAVDRNRVKRQLREAYRHHRSLLAPATADGQRLAIAFVWLADRLVDSQRVDARVASLLERIATATT